METKKTTPPPMPLKGVHIAARPLPHLPEPLALFERLTEDGQRPHTVLLESAEPSSRKTQKSLLVVSSALSVECYGARVVLTALNAQGKALLPVLEKHFERFSPQLEEKVLHLRIPVCKGEGGKTSEEGRLKADSCLVVLRELAALLREALPSAPEAVFLAGIFAYDLVEQFEPLPEAQEENPFPDCLFYLADGVVEIDHLNASAHLWSCTFTPGEDKQAEAEAEALLAKVEAAMAEEEEEEGVPTNVSRQATLEAVTTDMEDEAFAAKVEVLKKHMVGGDLFQIVLSRTFSMPCTQAFEAYRSLRALNPSPYLFYLRHEAFSLLGASPESSVKVDGKTRRLEISPIAGTRRRGLRADGSVDADLDSRIEAELRLDEKENAEHMSLVDLARNDVARVCKPGTRHVADLLRTERYSHVMHLVSRVSGELRDEFDALHAYQASMNMGTLTGAPKLKAMQLLRHHERGRRGHYGGAIGYVRGDGSFDTAIVIRAALVHNGVAHIRAGAGIVHDSVPLLEAEETRRKAEAVLRAIAMAEAKQQSQKEKAHV